MPILQSDIDPLIRDGLKDRIAQLFVPNAVLDPAASRVKSAGAQEWKRITQRNAPYMWASGASLLFAFLGAPIVGGLGGGDALALIPAVGGITGAIWLLAAGSRKTREEASKYVHPGLMRSAHELISLSRAERIYCEAIAGLSDAEGVLPPEATADILQQLNELVDNHRKLEGSARQSAAVTGNQSIQALEAELADLMHRRQGLDSAMAQATMDQSIHLCNERLLQARRLAPMLETSVAQQELIVQTLASVSAALARIGLGQGAASPTEIEKLHHSVAEANRQARAVEEAVHEVVALRG